MKIHRFILPLLFILTWNIASAQTADTADPAPQAPGPDSAPMIDYDNPRSYVIKDIQFHGVEFLNTDILTSLTGLSVGDTVQIPGNAISHAISRLWSQRQGYFADVNVIADIDGEYVTLEVYLEERPRVFSWLFEGIRKGEASTLTEDLKLKRGTELSDYLITRYTNLIKKHFWGKGFRNVEVTHRIENDPVMKNAVNVTFVIDKKDRVKIGKISFEGNETFSDQRLRRTLKDTHQKSINIFQSAKFDEDKFEDDKENLLDFYNSKGFRNAVILSDSIYVINDKRLGIHIKIDEGNIFYINDVKWIGNTKYSTELLNQILGIKKGDIYDKKTIHQRLGIGKEVNPDDPSQISSMYQNEGYISSNITPMEIVVAEDSISLEIKIVEGGQYTIGNVDISGNMRVDDEVIRREIYTRPGELYNRALVMQSLRQLAQMQHFDSQTLMPDIRPISNDEVDISWPLTETPHDKFELSGGWGANMFVFSVGVQFTNVAMQNFFKKGAWRPYPEGKNQQVTVRVQTNGSYYHSAMLGFADPWFGGKRPNTLNVSAYYSKETNAYSVGGIFQKATAHFSTVGLAVGLGRRLSWPDQNFTLYNEVGYNRYDLLDWQYAFRFTNGTANIFTFKTVFSRNTINYPIYPSSGSELMLSLALTPPYSLFNGVDYRTMTEYTENYKNSGVGDADTYQKYESQLNKWVEFHKWLGSVKWFLPLTMNQKLVLMVRAEMGYLGHYNRYKISAFEGFNLGGDGMSGFTLYGADVIALRGYSDGSLNPYYNSGINDFAKVYNRYTLELRHPIIMQQMATIYGLVFAEAGNSFKSWQDFDPFTLKRSLGFGVRVYLPYIGMIGVDWGYGFDKAVGATTRHGGKIHFMIGMQF